MEQHSKESIINNLNYFTGTTTYYKAGLGIVFTDGVKYLADQCKCYWLIDMVMSWQLDKQVKKEEFQLCRLKVNHEDNSAVFTIEDGNYNIIAQQDIVYTDFPLDEIVVWYSNKVIYLPSEH